MENVEYLKGGDLVALDVKDKVRVLCQVLYGFFGYVLGKLYGKYLVNVLYRNRGVSYDSVKRADRLLNPVYPLGIDGLDDLASRKRNLGIRRSDEHRRIVKGGEVLSKRSESGEGSRSDFFVKVIHI